MKAASPPTFPRQRLATVAVAVALIPCASAQDAFGSDAFDSVRALAPFARGAVLVRSQDDPGLLNGYDEDPYADPYGDLKPRSREPLLWDHGRADSLPPVALPYTHLLAPGEWVFAYRFEYQSFDGLRDGRDDVSSGDVLAASPSYAFAPTEMTWQKHTFEGYYGYDEHWSLFASLPFLSKEMDLDVAAGAGLDDQLDNSGIGDVRIGLMRDIHLAHGALARAHLGLGLPTGSYDEKDGGEPLPFPMQLGIGTVALHPGFTYARQAERWSYGMWGEGRLHLGRNEDDYSAGDSFQVTTWAAYPFSRCCSGSLRLDANLWGDYNGESDTIDEDRSPVNEDERQGGARIDLYGGVQWDIGGQERLHRLGLEVGFPVDEWLDGPQLSTELLVNVGWQVSL